MTIITEEGLYPDLDFADYLADPVVGGSLSHSGARTLIEHTPALFDWQRTNGRPNTSSFDFGHAAHRLVLGDGIDIVRIDADSWRTKAAKEAAEEARAAGAVPLLAADVETVTAMADVIRRHPVAAPLLASEGQSEVSAFARDEQTGVMLRCRYDRLPTAVDGERLLIVDYKSCLSADPVAFGKSAAQYGYSLQDAFYTAIAKALGMERVAYLFIAQEKSPPYLVNVIQLDHTAVRIGQIQMRRAIDIYKRCSDADDWPGYPPDIALASLPIWHERQYEDDLAS